MENGFTDGQSWVCTYVGDTGVRIWQPGDKTTALALFEYWSVSANVGPHVNRFGTASRVDVGPRVWDKPAHRWRQNITDTVNDVSFGHFNRSAAEERAFVLADNAPINNLCAGPFAEDLCDLYPPADVRVVSLEGANGWAAGWFMVCAKSPSVDTPLFAGDFPRITGVIIQGLPDNSSFLFFVGKSVAVNGDGNHVAQVSFDNGLGNVVLQGVAPWQDGTGVIVDGVDTPTTYPIPDGYELAAIVFLADDDTPTIYHAHIQRSPSVGFQVQQTAIHSLRVRTVYTEEDGSTTFADDTVVTRGSAAVIRGPEEPTTPTGLHFADLSESRDVPIVPFELSPPVDTTVWAHRLRAVWAPGNGDRQRVFVAVDIPAHDSFQYEGFVPDFGPHEGEQCYTETPVHVDAVLTSRVYEVSGGASFLDFEVPPGSLVSVFVRGESGPPTDTTPGAAARVQTTMTAYGQEDPESDYSAFIPTPIDGEGNL